MQGLWPLAEGTIIAQFLISEQPQDSALTKVAGLYHMLLLVLPDREGASGQGQGRNIKGLSSALVSGLAFGCNILQGLWRCAWRAMHPAIEHYNYNGLWLPWHHAGHISGLAKFPAAMCLVHTWETTFLWQHS